MKKAKVVLSAVALFAVVGGALAFKASRVPSTLYKTTTTLINGVTRTYCNATTQTLYTTDPAQGPSTFVTTLHTAPTMTTCPGITLYRAD